LRATGFAGRLAGLFGRKRERDELFEELEELLIESDFGARASMEAVDELRDRGGKVDGREELALALKELLLPSILTSDPAPPADRLSVFLLLGVNGVGKTTNLAKLAHYYRSRRGIERIILCAADTFRAAAIDQLELHGRRLGLRVVSQKPGSDPGAVIYDSITSARAQGENMILVDTAGRMHSKSDLVRQLGKLDKVVRGRIGEGYYHKMLVIDATTGQNALQQAEVFHEAVGVDSVLLAKSDSTAGGGIVVPVCRTVSLPFSFMGVGESLEDLVPFDPQRYLADLLGL
jgi:fused signal recognition particle receptor